MYPVAYAALLLLVPFTALAFALLRPHVAAATVMVAAALFLPERIGVDLPVLPVLDKRTVPPLLVFVALLFSAPQRLAPSRLLTRGDWLLAGYLGAVLASGFTNGDPLLCGPQFVPGVSATDALSAWLNATITVALPYLIGKAVIRDSRELGEFATVVLVACVLYLPLIAFELRMSPQLHRMVYGFAQHEFAQAMRGSGYRPMVFMEHGLSLALFVFAGTVLAWATGKARSGPLRTWAWPIAAVMTAILVLVKSVGALLYGVFSVLLLLLVQRRWVLLLSTVTCLVVLTYPSTRATGTFPAAALVELAEAYSAERAQSLDFRFLNEDLLLTKATQRSSFGWGPMGRNRVCDETGRDAAVTDGAWIIVYGSTGAVGFFALFGLLTNAVMTGARTITRLARPAPTLLLGLLWINLFHLVDLLPNGMFSYFNVFFAGCLVAAARGIRNEARRARTAARPRARAAAGEAAPAVRS